MKTDFKVGDSVRVRGAEPVGIVDKVDGDYATVRYEHRPGMFTAGYYPVGHLDRLSVGPDRLSVGGPPSPQPSPPGEGVTQAAAKPRATTRDVLPKAL